MAQTQVVTIDGKGSGKKKRVTDPNAPKKPLTAFFVFLRKRRMEMSTEEASGSAAE